MTRPFRLFSTYDFFSVFVPGLATLMGFYMLLPRPESLSVVVAIIPVLVLAFVFGQALHSMSALTEKLLGHTRFCKSHRTHFAEKITNPKCHQQRVVDHFKEQCAVELRDDSYLLSDQGALSVAEWKELYPVIQSKIYSTEGGRSQTFQAIYAFSRSMSLLLLGLPVLYFAHYFFRTVIPVVDRPPKYLQFFPSFADFIEVAIPLCWLGSLLFLYSVITYKRNFVKYLLSDFIVTE